MVFDYHLFMKQYLKSATLFVLILAIASWIVGCADSGKFTQIDTRSGIVSKNYHPEIEKIVPISITLDSKYKYYYISDHFVFLGRKDTLRYALATTFGRALSDNKFIRASRDFSGFLFDGNGWVTLPYTKMKHDSTRLELSYPYIFGGLEWQEPCVSGSIRYSNRGTNFTLQFRDLAVVQYYRDGDRRLRAHAIGTATLILPKDTIAGNVYYELTELEGYNPMDNRTDGIEYTNYDWMALIGESGVSLLVNSDSTTVGDRLLKNFFLADRDGSLSYAEGSEHVRLNSDDLKRDIQIYEWLALKKMLSIPELGIDMSLDLQEPRVFYTSGYCVALVTGWIERDSIRERVWGLLEHRQQPKSSGQALK